MKISVNYKNFIHLIEEKKKFYFRQKCRAKSHENFKNIDQFE